MTITVRQHIMRTSSELAMGRLMRAPDHPSDSGSSAEAAPAAPAEAARAAEPISAERAMEIEFGQVETPAPEAEGEAKPEDAGVDGDVEGDEGEGDAEGDKPKGKTPQERINEVTAARREAERLAAEANRQAEYWRGVAEGKGQQPVDPNAPKVIDPEAEPDPVNYEFGEADAKFIGDTARYHARAEWKEQQERAELNTQVATMEANWQGQVAKAVETYPDFDTVVNKGADEGKWKCSPVIALGIKHSEHGADIAYELAKNPTEAERIWKLTPMEQAREFGRMEGKWAAAAQSTAKADEAPVRPTGAPPPPKGGARGAGGKFVTSPDTDDFAAFEKMADATLAPKATQ